MLRRLMFTALIPIALIFGACGEADPPDHFGVYMIEGGHLTRLKAHAMSEFTVTEGGLTRQLSTAERSTRLDPPSTSRRNAEFYVHSESIAADSIVLECYRSGETTPVPVIPLVKPVEDQEHMYRMELDPTECPAGYYEMFLPGNLVCAFRYEPKK